MKKCLLTLLCITYFSCLFAQNLERKYPSDKNSPVWTQLMYAEDADVDAVVNAYTAYYKTHKFVKNSHTQYYKRWLRSISRDVDGLQYGEKDPKAVAKSTEKYIERSLQLRAEKGPTSAWQGVGPFDFDKEAESRSYAAGAAHVYGVEQAMSNTDVLYAGTATAGVWKTTDKGENWTLMTADMALNSVFALEIDHTNENVVYFEGNGNVYKTTDGGTTWNTIGDAAFMSASHSAKDIVMHPTNNQVLFLSSNNGLYRTDDAGDNWTQILAGNFQEIEFHPTDLSIIYAIKQIDNRTEFYKSTDSGASFSIKIDGWPGVSSSTTSNNFNAIKFDGNVANYISTTNLALGEGSFEEFTIEMLVKSTGWTGDPALLSNKNWSNGNNKGFILSANSNGAWKFNIGDGSGRIDLDGGTINDDKWHHIAVTYSLNGDKKAYHDGVLISSEQDTLFNSVATTFDLGFGQDGTLNYGYGFDGQMADVRVWNTALDQTTLNQWRCENVDNLHPNYANLTNHWRFNEGNGSNFLDNIGANNATASGTLNWQNANIRQCITYEFAEGDEQERTEIAVSLAAPNKIYALATGSANGGSGLYGIYVSEDAGETWTRNCCGPQPAGAPSATNQNLMAWSDEGTDDGGQYYYDVAFDVSPTNADSLFLGGVNLWISGDGGNTFACPSKWSHSSKVNYVHADIHDIRFFGEDIWIACDGGIFYSDNGGATFPRKMKGIQGTDFWGFGTGFWDGEVMLGGTYHNGTLLKDNNVYDNGWLSTDGGDNIRGFSNFGKDRVVFSDYNKKTLSGDRTVGISTVGYEKKPNASYIIGESSEWIYDPRCFNIVYSGNETSLWRSENDGASFELVYDFGEKVTAIEIAWTNPDIMYVATWDSYWGGGKKVWRTADAGQTWTNITPVSSWIAFDIAVSSYDANIVWVIKAAQRASDASNGNKVYYSTDGGANWTNITTPDLDDEYLTNIVHQRGSDGGIYIGTRRAVYYKNNSMSNFVLFNNNLPLSTYSTKLVTYYRGGKIRNGTNRSAYECDFYEQTPPAAQIAADRFDVTCLDNQIQFVDHSAVSGQGTTWYWEFENGTPSTSTLRNPLISYDMIGSHDVTLTVTDAFGTNTQTYTDFINFTDELVAIPLAEDFETADIIPTSWTSTGSFAWQEITMADSTTANCETSNAIWVNHYGINSVGEEGYLTTNSYDLSNAQDAVLSYDYAYARWGGGYNDGFRAEVSSNCGQTWDILFDKAGAELATAPDNQSSWIPTCNDWRHVELNLGDYAGMSIKVRLVGVNAWGNNFYLDNINITPFSRFRANVLLEGAYDAGTNTMNTALNPQLPLSQPYNTAPWNYDGRESVETMPADIVDWVMVEARNSNDNSQVVASTAALLRNDGAILHTDGKEGAALFGLDDMQDYYFVVRHRNHVDVITQNTLNANINTTYNLADANNIFMGTNQLAEVSTGIFAMKAGDFDGNNIVTVADFNIYLMEVSGLNDYLSSDCTLDAIVSVADYNAYITNASVIGVSAVRF